MELIQAYGCSYCAMSSRRRSSVTRHESDHCRKNPHRVTCNGCENFSYEEGEDHGCLGREPPSWFCLAKEEELEYESSFNSNIICSDYRPINPPKELEG